MKCSVNSWSVLSDGSDYIKELMGKRRARLKWEGKTRPGGAAGNLISSFHLFILLFYIYFCLDCSRGKEWLEMWQSWDACVV